MIEYILVKQLYNLFLSKCKSLPKVVGKTLTVNTSETEYPQNNNNPTQLVPRKNKVIGIFHWSRKCYKEWEFYCSGPVNGKETCRALPCSSFLFQSERTRFTKYSLHIPTTCLPTSCCTLQVLPCPTEGTK